MKIGDRKKLTESGLGENDDSNIRYYCKTEELFDVLETAHVNIGHKAQQVKDTVLFVILKNILFNSSFLNFCFFLSVMEAKLKNKFSFISPTHALYIKTLHKHTKIVN